jgi:hypothetical protein
MAQIRQISKFQKIPKVPMSYDNFQKGSQEYRSILFHFYLHIDICSQNLTKLFFGLITTLATSQNPSKERLAQPRGELPCANYLTLRSSFVIKIILKINSEMKFCEYMKLKC